MFRPSSPSTAAATALLALGVVFAGACDASRTPTAPSGTHEPLARLAAEARVGTTRGFTFVGPGDVPARGTFDGTFDPDVNAFALVCAGTGACSTSNAIAIFTRTRGTGGGPLATMRVSNPLERYSATWDTRRCESGPCTLDPAITYRLHVRAIAAGGAEVALGFADLRVVQRQEPDASTDYLPILNGRPFTIAFRVAAGIPGGLQVAPVAATLGIRETAPLAATLTDLHGRPLGGMQVAWSVVTSPASGVADAASPLAPATGTTGSDGVARTVFTAGAVPGTAVVSAITGTLQASATLTVEGGNMSLSPSTVAFEGVEAGADPAPSVVAISSDGSPLRTLAVSVTYGPAAAGWLAATLDRTTSPAELTLQPSIAGLAPGTYEADVTVTSPIAANGAQSATVTLVIAPRNVAPVVNAGSDVTVKLPATASLVGSVTDDGLPAGAAVATTWSKVSGPGTVTFATPLGSSTTASFSAAGSYVLRLSATDGELTTTDDVSVTVLPAENLRVSVTGSGAGSVFSTSLGLSCPAVGCTVSREVAPGTYELNAFPATGSYFSGWGGDAASCGTSRTCTIAVGSTPVAVTAAFEPGRKLTVLVAGYAGNGYVSFEPSTGYACNGGAGSTCTFWYAPGSSVTLYTREYGGYSRASNFVGWSGVSGCGTEDECTITFGDEDVTVTATFTLPVWVAVEGNGSGRVTTSPAGIDCTFGTFCGRLSLVPGQTVTFTATPNAGSVVDRWDTYNTNAVDAAVIRACGSATTCTITPTGYLHVRLFWKPDPALAVNLTVGVIGTGAGSAFSTSLGLSCPAVGCSTTKQVAPGTYEITAFPAAGSYFAGWGGDAASCGTNRTCQLTAGTSDLNVTAAFEPGRKLTVLVAGYVGNSYVSFEPSTGYACNGGAGSTCTFWYGPGSSVKLYTREYGGYSRASNFVGWSGVSGCGTEDECTITFGSEDVTVTATFTLPVWVAVEGTGSGRVTTSPAGIDCTFGTFCGRLSLVPGESVTFTATPNAGSAVDRWDTYNTNAVDAAVIRACGSATTCTITPTGYLHVRLFWKAAAPAPSIADVGLSGSGSDPGR